jgi:hypothetical protein
MNHHPSNEAGQALPNDGAMAPGDEAPPGLPGTGEAPCPDCGGSGRIGGATCKTCLGAGKVNVNVGDA